ncbi:iron-containing redox enzyme family protein [Streptomyces sp. NPDC058157]|uniref:iron-containing redox enzyme family protein n=1 Tax=Streptomyces sp. NPDC058157 TaxID=3346360 RepID=UPI0036EC513D
METQLPSSDHHTVPVLRRTDAAALVDEVSSWLTVDADEIDAKFLGERARIVEAVTDLNAAAVAGPGREDAHYHQQLLLSRIYQTVMQIPDRPSAEGSVLLHEVTRLLENATLAAEDAHLEPGLLESAPTEPKAFLSWLKGQVRVHRAFKHPYYTEFINREAREEDLRTYVIQESLIDGRFDDFLAMMQIGTAGASKMEIAANYWDEMGNGDPEAVHTHLFNKIYEVFDVRTEDLEAAMTTTDLHSGNLAVLLCRYRHLYPEAVGFLGMTEWLAPDRFRNVVRAWERLGLPEVGITYHRLHITIDSQHAAGWFHNVVIPSAGTAHMRRGIARGALWRANSSARHLDERLDLARLSAERTPVAAG